MLEAVGIVFGICVIALFLMGTALAAKACWVVLNTKWNP